MHYHRTGLLISVEGRGAKLQRRKASGERGQYLDVIVHSEVVDCLRIHTAL